MPTESALLSEVPLFALLDEQERGLLAERIEHRKYPAGRTIFAYGDPGDSLYIVASGEVEIWFKNDTGEKIVLEVAKAGDFFGEMSLLDPGPRMATAATVGEVEVLEVDRGDLDQLFRLRPAAALDLLAATGRRLRETSRLLRHTATRNVNAEEEDQRTKLMKFADWISDFSGSLSFLFLHVVIFFVWIILNVHMLPFGDFDPFPFGLLTMVVSLEAIILSVFVLLSQNRQTSRDRMRNEVDYQVNLKAELEIAHMHEKVDHMHAEILARLSNLEKSVGTGTGPAAASPPAGRAAG